eukprot:GHVS01076416.1.p1 GENE.GHVS01076416.1~~GHVS01076416.1.p1  ORF type:complete len:244 (-),score=17.01 GHVS01076416.1:407-1138(-)
MAGICYAQMLCQVKYHQANLRSLMTQYTAFYTRRRWHQLRTERGQLGRTDEVVVNHNSARMNIVRESVGLLREALAGHIAGDDVWSDLFEIDFYNKLVGQFQLVDVDIEIGNPLDTAIYQKGCLNKCTKLFRDLRCIVHGYGNSGVAIGHADDVFCPFMGVGLYRTVALTNHSCDPNVEVDYELDYTIQVRAIRDISVGEEITQSYIDESLPLHDRSALLLQRYGFVCRCTKCEKERKAASPL